MKLLDKDDLCLKGDLNLKKVLELVIKLGNHFHNIDSNDELSRKVYCVLQNVI